MFDSSAFAMLFLNDMLKLFAGPVGKDLNEFRFNNVTGLDMAALQQAQLNGASFNAVDLTGFSAAGKNMDSVRMVNATITASQLATASSLRSMDLRSRQKKMPATILL